jgi:hypothetical protein
MVSPLLGASLRRWSWIVLLIACAACQAEVSSPSPSRGQHPAQLEDDDASCAAVDDADTTCDVADDDCDGALDEDCEFGPADCPPGARVIAGDHGSNWLWGRSGRDCILGYGGDDVLVGLDGDDVLVGGPGDDALIGGDGRDALQGDRGADTLSGDRGDDRLDGGEGNDFLFGGDGRDELHGGACHDNLLALLGSDLVFGDEGADRVVTVGAGHRVDGGGGTDACTGPSPTLNCELTGARARLCVRDADCGADQRCVTATKVCVPEGDASGSDATCDGYDDDCDGALDEDHASEPTQCGVGACAASGESVCSEGELEDSCTPGAPAPDDSSCDALDDDCDGASDEHYAPLPTSCGVGACAATGMTACVNGVPADSCMPGAPAPDDSSCDALDDDCDGANDEHYAPLSTSCGVGACASTGATECVAGTVGDTCLPGTPAPDDASCDAVDDDCDGRSDEAYAPLTTFCEVGGCLAQGATACSEGVEQDQCLLFPTCIAEIACDDELDNDGDAFADCADVDCDGEEHCRPQPFAATVEGQSNLWGAGHASAPGGGLLPVGIALRLRGGATMRFSGVTGTIHNFEQFWGPDGVPGGDNLPTVLGLSGYRHFSRSHGLAGVFLTDAEPADPPPGRLSIPNAEFTELRPGLRQIFYIGDGVTSSGVQQRFIVPNGATRLFLGHAHYCSNGRPGCTVGLAGMYEVQAEIKFEH